MHDDDHWHLTRRFGRLHQIATHLPVPVRRRVVNIFRENIGVGKFHLFRESVIRFEHIKQRQRRHTAHSVACSQIQKLALVNFAVRVVVVIFDQLLRKIFGGQARHRISPGIVIV
ncbi:hypothetical protein D3C80_1076700 [compost metagenome]